MIANAKKGDVISVRLNDNSIKIIELTEIKTYGVEGYPKNLLKPPLTFYPFHNILSISKTTK